MAVVREELRLVDYFSGPLISYAQGVRTARQGTAALQSAARQLTATQRTGAAAAQTAARVQGQLAGVQRQQAAAARAGANAGQQAAAAGRSVAGAAQVMLGATRSNTTATNANTSAVWAQTAALQSQTAALGVVSAVLAQHNRMQTQARIAADVATAEMRRQQGQMNANRARGSYLDMTATVSKLGVLAGQAFDSTKELVAFTELLNKNFVVGGAAAQEQSAAMYQLTQAMASGRLQGDEYRSIIENAPLLAQSIEDYMRNVQKAEGSMKDWASQGLLTSEVIKAAMFNSADEVEKRFASMPQTWGQTWQLAQNIAIKTFQPLLQVVGAAAGFVSEHIEAFIGAFYGLAAVVAVYYTAVGIATIASKGLIATLMESPLLPIAATFMAIGAAIGVFIDRCGGAKAAWLTFVDAALTFGENLKIGFISIFYHIQNEFDEFITNFWEKVYNIQNAVDYVIAQIARISYGDSAIDVYENKKAARAADLADRTVRTANNAAERAGNISAMKLARDVAHAGRLTEIDKARSAGEAKGFDYSQFGGEAFSSTIADNTASIAGDTKAIKNAVDMSDETLKMLVDMAERRHVNNINLTAQSPVIQVQGQNTGDTMADRYKLADALRDVLLEQASAGAAPSTAMAF